MKAIKSITKAVGAILFCCGFIMVTAEADSELAQFFCFFGSIAAMFAGYKMLVWVEEETK